MQFSQIVFFSFYHKIVFKEENEKIAHIIMKILILSFLFIFKNFKPHPQNSTPQL